MQAAQAGGTKTVWVFGGREARTEEIGLGARARGGGRVSQIASDGAESGVDREILDVEV
jgi:hypothetical protein